MNQDWLDQYKGVEYLKNKKERDWKFIIGMIVLLAIFAVMGGAFWNMVGKQAQMVREEEQKEEENKITIPEGVNPELLMKVLGNPEMAALLTSLAKTMKV